MHGYSDTRVQRQRGPSAVACQVRCTPSCRQALTAYDYSPCAPWAVEQLQMPKDEKEM